MILAVALSLVSAAFTLWRNSEIGVLVDISYIVNTATRIAAGDVPYAQFPLAQAPLEFLVQALLIKIGGPHFAVQIMYATILGGLGTALTFVIAHRLLRDAVASPDVVAAVLCLPLVPLGVYAVYPHPFYDADACVLVLGVLATTLFALDRPTRARWVIAGVLLVVPAFMKQNIGGALAAAMLAALSVDASTRPDQRRWFRWYVAGFIGALVCALVVLQVVVGIEQYVRWTVGFALSARGVAAERFTEFAPPAVVAIVLAPLVRGSRPGARAVALTAAGVALLARTVIDRSVIFAPGFFPAVVVATVGLAILRARREGATLATLFPIVVAITTLGVLQSQGLVGSSFAIFPLLVVALAALVRDVAWAVPSWPAFAPRLGMGLALALVLIGTVYTLSEARLFFIDVWASGPVQHSTYPSLAGLSARGPYLADLDEILRWIDAHVPPDETIAFVPGEEPAFFALARRPVLPSVYFFDVATPYSPQELARIADERGLRWVFVKDRLQLTEAPPLTTAIAAALTEHATLVERIGAYRVYRR